MSTPAPIIVPDEIQPTGIPDNAPPLMRRAWDLNLDEKLTRYRNCGYFSRYRACDNGHLHCERSSRCGLRGICKDCAVWGGIKQFHKYAPLEKFFERFISIRIKPREAATHDSIRTAELKTGKVLRRLYSQVIMKVTVNEDHRPEVRLILNHPSGTTDEVMEKFKATFPDAHVVGTLHLSTDFHKELEKLTADPNIGHADPYRADMELMLESIRQIHVLGFRNVELVVCREHTDNLTPPDAKNAPHACIKCKTCGLPMNHLSGWFPTYEFPQGKDPKLLKWKDGWQPQAA